MVDLVRDTDKGWVIHEGDPRWRTTIRAFDDLAGKTVDWFVVPRRAHVMTIGGKPVGKLWYYPVARQWSVRLTGFEFFHYNRVLQRDMFDSILAFPTIKEAKTYAETILVQVGANIGAITKAKTFRGKIAA